MRFASGKARQRSHPAERQQRRTFVRGAGPPYSRVFEGCSAEPIVTAGARAVEQSRGALLGIDLSKADTARAATPTTNYDQR